jgi:hypothetical protein
MMRFVAGVRWGVRAKDAGSVHMSLYGRDRGRGLAPSSAARGHKAHCVGASKGSRRRRFAVARPYGYQGSARYALAARLAG